MSERSRICLFRRSNGFYYVVLTRDAHKRWKSTHCRSKSEALQFVARSVRLFEPKLLRKPLTVFIREFLEYAKATFSPGTVYL